jgi:hypothetical protein
MRNLFLTLVLVNLGFAAWQGWFAPVQQPTRPADTSVPTLTLVSEVDERARPTLPDTVAPAPADPSPADGPGAGPEIPDAARDSDEREPDAADPVRPGAAPPAPNAASGRCVSVGPFQDLSEATSAAATLRASGYSPTQRAGEGDIWIGYWVYIPRIPTEERAAQMLATLRDNGMTDPYLIPRTDSGNLISLGIFSEMSRAGVRRDAARELGFEPVIADSTRRGTVHWVDVVLARNQTLDVELLQSPGRIVRLEQRSCEPAER